LVSTGQYPYSIHLDGSGLRLLTPESEAAWSTKAHNEFGDIAGGNVEVECIVSIAALS
jgi:hypothetical protein